MLADLIRKEAMERALVFTRTKHGADKVVRYLGEEGISAVAIHGNKSQAQRERALASFKDGQTKILIATDIAARGIDVDAVSHVVNYDLPNIPESYVHRIGRTARAGAEGRAISLCDGEERAYLRSIEKLTRQTIPSEDRRDPNAPVAPAEKREPRRPQHQQSRKPSGAPGRNGPRTDGKRTDGQRPEGGRAFDHKHGAPGQSRGNADRRGAPGGNRPAGAPRAAPGQRSRQP